VRGATCPVLASQVGFSLCGRLWWFQCLVIVVVLPFVFVFPSFFGGLELDVFLPKHLWCYGFFVLVYLLYSLGF